VLEAVFGDVPDEALDEVPRDGLGFDGAIVGMRIVVSEASL